MPRAGCAGGVYFRATISPPDGSWELTGAQLTVFQQLLGDPRTASVLDLDR